jgi:hypothetical protein
MADANQPPNPFKRKPRLSLEKARSLFLYEPETGLVRRRVNVIGGGPAGSVAGGVFDGQGHLGCTVDRERIYLHCLIWFLVTGEWPTADIDHVNDDPADNRWANLREASRSQNLMNKRRDGRNTSGVKGVYFDKSRLKWCAEIKAGAIRERLGRFDRIEDAAAAVLRARQRLHGEFARVS